MENLVVLCTCPSADVAQTLANTAVERGLAACVNILPGVISVYRWQGVVETTTEHLLVIKTHASVYPALESTLIELHPYQLPEVIALPILRGLPAYMDWIVENTSFGKRQ